MVRFELKYGLLLIFGLLFFQNNSLAQKLEASANKKELRVGQRFEYKIKATNMTGELSFPDFKDFDHIAGPMRSTQQTNINGYQEIVSTFSFTLAAKAMGEFTIPSAVVVDGNGKKTKSNSVKVVVNQQGQRNNPSVVQPNKNQRKDVYATIELGNTQPYVGEVVTMTYKLYCQKYIRISSYLQDNPPDGIWKEEVEFSPSERRKKEAMVNDTKYYTDNLQRSILIPSEAGKVEIQPFDMEFSYRFREIALKSNTATLDVRPLPPPPSNFAGGVGQLRYKVTLDKNNVEVGDVINLTVSVSGSGNLRLITAPDINWPEGLEVFDPQTEEKIDTEDGFMTGSKTFEYLIIPRKNGDFKLDQLQFAHFDPTQEKYIQSKPVSLNLTVEGNMPGTDDEKDNSEAQSDNKIDESDSVSLWKIATPILLLSLLAVAAFFMLRKKKTTADTAPIPAQTDDAANNAFSILSEAEKALKGNQSDFYGKITAGLRTYLREKFDLSLMDMNPEGIQSKLGQKGVNTDNIKQLNDLFSKSQMAQYVPMSENDNQQLLADAKALVQRMEK